MRPAGLRRTLRRAIAAGMAWLRALSGDDAYDRYLTHHACAHAGPPLSRRAFYREREERKWSGISRCC
ncbi:MAG TPA: YbdD/YjiX family protein [Steroidobacteraceae bacterium]